MARRWAMGRAAAILLLAAQAAGAQAVTAAPKLDLNRFMGTWYEIALLPNKKEKLCVSDAMMLYSLADKPNRAQLVSACRLKTGTMDADDANVRTADKSGDGRLKVSYTWPFSTKYWVLAVGPEYEWALMGSPNRKLLWVLSRTREMRPEVLTEVEAKAAAEGFATAKMVRMPHGQLAER